VREGISFSLLNLYATLYMRSRARVLVKGQESLPPKAPGEGRVYLVINHTASFDLVALAHVAEEPFSVLMDCAAFKFPIIRHILKGAGFIPLDKADSRPAVDASVEAVKTGRSLVVSLYDGASTLGERVRPRTGGIRIAQRAGAKVFPVFLGAEPSRIRRRSFRGLGGAVYPYTTFRDCLYFIEFLKPIELPAVEEDSSYESLHAVAETLDAESKRLRRDYEALVAQNAFFFDPLGRRGGAGLRIAF